jgi:hypothetical protein
MKNRTETALETFRSAFRCGSPKRRGSDPASARLDLGISVFTPGQVRVLFILNQKRQTDYRNLRSAERLKKMMACYPKKNPSDATNKRNSELYNPTNIGSRKHAVFATHCRSARPLQQRAGSKYFSDSR